MQQGGGENDVHAFSGKTRQDVRTCAPPPLLQTSETVNWFKYHVYFCIFRFHGRRLQHSSLSPAPAPAPFLDPPPPAIRAFVAAQLCTCL
jgi:hypothetical protein